jgi:hypothetical protein
LVPAAEISWDASTRNRLVAMHWRRTPEVHEILTRLNFDIIVTARHPLDVLISILQFSQHEPATALGGWATRVASEARTPAVRLSSNTRLVPGQPRSWR